MQRSTLFGSLGYNRRLISSRTSFILQRCDSSSPLAGGCMPSGKRAERRSLARLVPRCNAATFAASDSFQPNASEPIDSIRAVSSGIPKWIAIARGLLFYLTTFAFAMPLFVFMLAIFPFVMIFDKFRRRGEHIINNFWAKLTTLFYYPIEIIGAENLPPSNQAAVYVSNHLSFLDIYTLFHLNRDFKFISKTSNFLIPIIGWSMFLTGHVMINRIDRRSQLECLKQCGELLKQGASVLFFPEGTRSNDGRLYSFKKGAFSVASKAKVPVVPITLIGTGDLMPNKKEYLLYPGKVQVIVHPAIAPQDSDIMMEAAYTAVASALPPERIAHS